MPRVTVSLFGNKSGKGRFPDQGTDPYPNKRRRTDLGMHLVVLFSPDHMSVPLHLCNGPNNSGNIWAGKKIGAQKQNK